MAYVVDLEKETLKNRNYRKVIYTSVGNGNEDHPKGLQLVLMCLKPKEEIGTEKHPKLDQFIKIESGDAMIVIGDPKYSPLEIYHISDGEAVLIPANTYHNIINENSRKLLTLYTLYRNPEHSDGLVQKTKPKMD
jgi:mannose-6-phosphate isomerase-like protein (cupin superfamily)